MLFNDNIQSVGRTPLVRLINLAPDKKIYAKVEGRNPTYSVKCRIGAAMISAAEQSGELKKGMTIVEPTSGNTGIALAYVAAIKGYSIILTMPETMSIERRKVLSFLGANILLTPGAEGMAGAIRKAEELAADKENYYMPQQFKNPANPAIHEKTTGPEIWTDTNGAVDVIVSGVGSGGTITGISRYIKNIQGKAITSVAVEPFSSPVISQFLAGEELKPAAHKIQGIGAGFIPDTLDVKLLDRVEKVTNEDAVEFSRKLAKHEGILAGISSGAATAVALRLADMDEFADKFIVVILPDAAERYLSSVLFEGI